jgi:oligoribonuclease
MDCLLWFDLETTGLDVDNDVILEVGWGVSDTAFEWSHHGGPRSMLTDLPVEGVKIDPFVVEMHEQSGLWADLETDSRFPLDEIAATILRDVNSLAGAEDRVVMAGAGVSTFDLPWVRRHMSSLGERLAYFTIDVSVIERFSTLVTTGEFRSSSKAAKHRAVDDIRYAHALALEFAL